MVNAAHGSPRAATSDPARVGDSVDRHPRERRVRRLQAKRCRRGSERKRQAWAWPGAVLHRTETVGATAKSTRPVPGRRMCSPVLLGKSSTAQLPQIRAKDAPAGAILPARYRRLASADRRATHPLPGGADAWRGPPELPGVPRSGVTDAHLDREDGTRGVQPARARTGRAARHQGKQVDRNRFCIETKAPERRDMQVPADRLASPGCRASRASRQSGCIRSWRSARRRANESVITGSVTSNT